MLVLVLQPSTSLRLVAAAAWIPGHSLAGLQMPKPGDVGTDTAPRARSLAQAFSPLLTPRTVLAKLPNNKVLHLFSNRLPESDHAKSRKPWTLETHMVDQV